MALGFAALLAFVLTSCLKDEEDNTVYYDDTGITSFTLGTLTRTLHTTSSTGEDSTYTASVTGSSYKFYIDQKQGLIYNVDSLPVNTDITRVLTTVGTKNSGTLAVNLRASNGLDSLVVHSSTDSLDFTEPLEFRVYSNSGIAYRKYIVTINVHQEEGDEFAWTQPSAGIPAFAALKNQRMFTTGDKVFLFGTDASGLTTRLFDVKASMSASDSEVLPSMEFGAEAINNIVECGDEVLVLDGTRLWHFESTGDETWESSYDDDRNIEGISRLVGASDKEIYALSTSGELMVTTDYCLTWAAETLDSDASLLPQQDINCVVFPLKTNDGMDRVTLIGTRSDRDYAVVWMKIVDEDEPGAGKWLLLSDGAAHGGNYPLPKWTGLSVVPYDGTSLAMGLDENQALSAIRMSADGGLNWLEETTYAWSDEASGSETLSATVDDSNTIWVSLGGTGQVWRGRLNRLGWTITE